MNRREFITLLLGSASVGWPLALRAQQSAMPTIGFLRSSTFADVQHWIAAFRQGLKEADFVLNTVLRRISRIDCRHSSQIWFASKWP
jgi:hypothetical protein